MHNGYLVHQQGKRAATRGGGISTLQRRQAMIDRAARAAAASREAEMRAARPAAVTEPPMPPPTPRSPPGSSLPLLPPRSKVAPATGPSAGASTSPLADEPWDALDASLALVGFVGLTFGLATARGAWRGGWRRGSFGQQSRGRFGADANEVNNSSSRIDFKREERII